MMLEVIDDKKLREQFKKKNYTYCVNELRREIKEKLISRLNIIRPGYKYKNIHELKINCFKYLNDDEKRYITILCEYTEKEYPITQELDELLDIYSKYCKK